MAPSLASFLLLLYCCSTTAVVGPRNDGRSSHLGRSRGFPEPCPTKCFCSSEAVQCTGWAPPNEDSTEGALQLSSRTEVLILESVPVSHLNVTAALENTERLRWLRIYNGELVTIPTLPDLPLLTFLDLSSNNIEFLPAGTFNHTPHIVKVNLSNNALANLSPLVFERVPDLKELDLSRNPFLSPLPADFFLNVPGLKFLDLSNTGLVNFTEMWADPLQELHFLNLSFNSINSVPELRLEHLAVLDLSHNPLLHLPQLEGFPHLSELFVSHSLISYLNVSSMGSCIQLKLLDLSHSNLTNINEHILSLCNNLEKIDLSYNLHLWRVEHGAFSGLQNLTILRLDHCPQLYDLEDEALKDLDNLRELHLQESGIKVLPTSVSQLKNLTLLNLEGTTLLCNCYGYLLPEILTSRKPSWRGTEVIRCNDGIDRSAKEITNHLRELECSKVEAYSVSDQWTLATWGQSALLECNITGNPEPRIIWQTVGQHMHVFNKSMRDHPWVRHQISQVLMLAEEGTEGKFEVMQSGQLLVRNVTRDDIGRYKCFAFNPVSNVSVITFLGIKDTAFRAFILESILFGFACATLFLLITLLVQFIQFIMDR